MSSRGFTHSTEALVLHIFECTRNTYPFAGVDTASHDTTVESGGSRPVIVVSVVRLLLTETPDTINGLFLSLNRYICRAALPPNATDTINGLLWLSLNERVWTTGAESAALSRRAALSL